MKALGYVKGTFSLIGDFFRLGMIFIKRPHYLLVLAGIVVGIFYLCGIPPKQLPEWWKKTFVPAVSSRVDEFAMRTKKAASPLTDAVSDFVSVPKKEPEKAKEPEPLFVTSPKAPVKWGRQAGKETGTQGAAAPVAPAAPKEEYKCKQKERTHPGDACGAAWCGEEHISGLFADACTVCFGTGGSAAFRERDFAEIHGNGYGRKFAVTAFGAGKKQSGHQTGYGNRYGWISSVSGGSACTQDCAERQGNFTG